MENYICTRCAANLTDGYCEYCGWNSPKPIQDKTLTLLGLLCNLTVTKKSCAFNPKLGASTVIANSEIAQISLSQAPVTGTGELSLLMVTGITKKITFLYTQNPSMVEIASYLLHVAPDAQFTSVENNDASASINMDGIRCPKCGSNNTKMTGKSRKLSIWKILCGILLVAMGIEAIGTWTSAGPVPIILIIVGGIALTAN